MFIFGELHAEVDQGEEEPPPKVKKSPWIKSTLVLTFHDGTKRYLQWIPFYYVPIEWIYRWFHGRRTLRDEL